MRTAPHTCSELRAALCDALMIVNVADELLFGMNVELAVDARGAVLYRRLRDIEGLGDSLGGIASIDQLCHLKLKFRKPGSVQ